MPADRESWARAFAEQARSDWRIYDEVLRCHPGVEACHRLHYLQMASEKIAKAYRLRDTAVDPKEAMSQHIAFSKFVRSYLSSRTIREQYHGRLAQLQRLVRFAGLLAREIERLAPAVDAVQTPANVEYPWLAANDVHVPCQESFGSVAGLDSPQGRNVLRYLKQAILEFDTRSIP